MSSFKEICPNFTRAVSELKDAVKSWFKSAWPLMVVFVLIYGVMAMGFDLLTFITWFLLWIVGGE